MKVTVKLFALARQIAEADEIEIELPNDSSTIAAVRTGLIERLPGLLPMNASLRFAVNSDYAADDTVVSPADELACIPPVSGG